MKLMTKVKLGAVALVIIAIVIAAFYLRYGGVTHENIVENIRSESAEIRNCVDDRYQKLDRKLDRIESKLDRLLEIATRPHSDELR